MRNAIRLLVGIVLAFAATLLGACAGLNPPDSYYQANATARQAQAAAEIGRANRSHDMELTCDMGCAFRYRHPDNAGNDRGPIDHWEVAQGDTAASVIKEGIREAGATLRDTAPTLGLVGLGMAAIDGAGRRIINVNGDGNQVQEDWNQLTSQRWGDHSANDRHDDSRNQSDNRTNYDNATATPSIVTQPAPIVTSPVVVNQPAPIVVDPVIVNPLVIQ